ncbi:MAG: hypothetical protein C5B50_21695 [Verrucomicrobia bacterium]|nr:MAG: hypothetical protein C5B50_21695 [Verrucomicrobiota bacterium]
MQACTNPPVRQSFDALVAGGGPAGSTTALELSRLGFSVALVEQDDYRTFRVGETLPPIIRNRLTSLGLWEQFLASEPLRSHGIRSAWEGANPREQDFLRNPYGCGWHVDRARFDALLAHAAAQRGAKLFLSARISSIHEPPGSAGILPERVTDSRHAGKMAVARRANAPPGVWLLDCTINGKGVALSGRMVVDATGRRAVVASQLGAHAHVADRLIGAVSVCPGNETEHWTLIEAAEEGWWYSAPLPGGRMIFTYMTDSDLWKEARWAELLASAPLTSERANGFRIPPPAHLFPAATLIRQPVAGADWIAVGDAALAFDPLSGQGVIKSIDCGMKAAATIARHLKGDSSALAEYETWVKDSHRTYLTERSQFYRSVQRWPQARFWKRRAAHHRGGDGLVPMVARDSAGLWGRDRPHP